MAPFPRITVNPGVAIGKPCIRDLRFPVSRLLGLLAAGETRDSILKADPYLEAADNRRGAPVRRIPGGRRNRRIDAVKFLVDMALSPDLAGWLRSLGHDAVHAAELQLDRVSDAQILSKALEEARVVITAALDFPRLLAIVGAEGPGLILLRGGRQRGRESRIRPPSSYSYRSGRAAKVHCRGRPREYPAEMASDLIGEWAAINLQRAFFRFGHCHRE